MKKVNSGRKIDEKQFLLAITIILFVGMYAIGMIVFKDKGFAKLQVFLNLLISNAGLIVIAASMTMVMITGGIDISVGSVVALVCMMLAWMMEVKGVGAVTALLVVLLLGLLFGLVQGVLVVYLKIQPFIVTLAGMFFARGMTAIISQEMVSIKNELFLSWAKTKINLTFLGGTVNKKGVTTYPFIYPSVLVALLILVIVFIVLKYTKFGRTIYAVGGNEQSALMMGLNVKRTKVLVYVINGLLCAVGGFLFCLNTCAGFVEQAKGFEMEAIAASVIGGTLLTGGVGNVFGSLFGVLIKGTIETFITFQGTLLSWWTKITIAVLLAFFIILQSLFAKAKEKRKNN